MEELEEKIGLLKDRLENINATLKMPIGDKFHVQALRALIPELIEDVIVITNELIDTRNKTCNSEWKPTYYDPDSGGI